MILLVQNLHFKITSFAAPISLGKEFQDKIIDALSDTTTPEKNEKHISSNTSYH